MKRKRSILSYVKEGIRATIPFTVVMLMVIPYLLLFNNGRTDYATILLMLYGFQMWSMSDL